MPMRGYLNRERRQFTFRFECGHTQTHGSDSDLRFLIDKPVRCEICRDFVIARDVVMKTIKGRRIA